MKKLTGIILLGLLVTLPLAAIAQPAPSSPPMMHKMDDPLNLSEQQRSQIDALRLDHEKQMMGFKDQLHSLRTQMNILITTNNPSTSEIKKLAGQIGDVTEKMAQATAEHKVNVRKLLTDEQKVKFDLMTLDRRGQMGRRGPGSEAPPCAPGCCGPMGRGMGMGMGMGMGPCMQHEPPH